MASLQITNLAGSPVCLAWPEEVSTRRHELEHEGSTTVGASSFIWEAKRSKLCVAVCWGPTGDDRLAPANANNSICVFAFRRPRSLVKQAWHTIQPICEHVTPCCSPRRVNCWECQRETPWRIYVLHSKSESRMLILRNRDMSSFLSETEDARLLSDVVLPGTHDSLAFYGWPVSQCQSPDQPLFTQLMSGIRVLDVRLAVIDGVLMAYHGAAPQRTSFAAILHTLHHFLRERPRECLVVSLKQEDFASTPGRVFSRLVREEIERSEGGMGLWWLENRVPCLGEVRGRCIMFSRFGGDGKEWEGRLEGMGIHPTEWPDSKQEGFEWDLKGTTVRTHDWYSIPNLLAIPEKTSLCIGNLVPPTHPPTLGITFLSAAGGALSLPPFCALGVGWPSWGMGIEGVNARVGKWLLDRLTANGSDAQDTRSEKRRWSVSSDRSDTELIEKVDDDKTQNGDKLPVRGWVFMDYFAQPDGGLVPLLVENNFMPRY